MDDKTLIERLWEYGHFRNPEYPDTHAVEQKDLVLLTLSDNVVRQAVRSYQNYFAPDLDLLTLKHHGRFAIADGDVAGATRELIELPRCGVPEFGAEKACANWPNDCRGSLTFGRDFEKLPGLSQKETDEVWIGICNNWNATSTDLFVKPILDVTVDPLTLDIAASLGALWGGTLAWSHLARNSCGVTLNQKYDSTERWTKQKAVTTGTHEVGHALGHQHVRDGDALMNPSIHSRSIARLGFPNSTDLRQHDRLGYTLRDNPAPPTNLWTWHEETPDDPTPQPEPTPDDKPRVEGVLTIDGHEYIVVPKPRI